MQELIPLLVPYNFFVSKVFTSDRIFLWHQVLGLDVDSEQAHRLDATFDGYCVDFPTNGLHLV